MKKPLIRTLIGWREWVSFPSLGIKRIKAKIDTGARTSAMHAYHIKPYTNKKGRSFIYFEAHPFQRNNDYIISCYGEVSDKRIIKNSGGQIELRYTIITELKIGSYIYPIELTLTNRDQMGFRLLLGRSALKQRYYVDPGKSFLLQKKHKKATLKK